MYFLVKSWHQQYSYDGPFTLCMVLQGLQSSSTIAKVLANIVASPAEGKFRKLRLANERIQKTIVDVDGGVELLQARSFAVLQIQ